MEGNALEEEVVDEMAFRRRSFGVVSTHTTRKLITLKGRESGHDRGGRPLLSNSFRSSILPVIFWSIN